MYRESDYDAGYDELSAAFGALAFTEGGQGSLDMEPSWLPAPEAATRAPAAATYMGAPAPLMSPRQAGQERLNERAAVGADLSLDPSSRSWLISAYGDGFDADALLSGEGVMDTSAARVPSYHSLYKTELCRSWEETGCCRYGGKCQFAHGQDELRAVLRHPRYKTELCRTFTTSGSCPYGTRCRFIHYRGATATATAPGGGKLTVTVPTLPDSPRSPRVSRAGDVAAGAGAPQGGQGSPPASPVRGSPSSKPSAAAPEFVPASARLAPMRAHLATPAMAAEGPPCEAVDSDAECLSPESKARRLPIFQHLAAVQEPLHAPPAPPPAPPVVSPSTTRRGHARGMPPSSPPQQGRQRHGKPHSGGGRRGRGSAGPVIE